MSTSFKVFIDIAMMESKPGEWFPAADSLIKNWIAKGYRVFVGAQEVLHTGFAEHDLVFKHCLKHISDLSEYDLVILKNCISQPAPSNTWWEYITNIDLKELVESRK